MKQLTLAAVGFDRYTKTTRRAAVLAGVERGVARGGGGCEWGGVVRVDGAVLSEAGQGPPASRRRADAAYLFVAAVVQSVGPGGGGGALRFAGDAPLCRDRSRLRAGARRDDSVPVPSPA